VEVQLLPSGAVNLLALGPTGTWVGTLVASEGPQAVRASAFVDGLLVAEGTASVLVGAGQVAVAAVTMLDVTGPPPPPGHGPIIRAITSTAAVLRPGQEATLVADAIDPDGDPITYQWAASCTDGRFGTPAAATTTFWSSSETGCRVTATATSGAFSTSRAIDLVIQGTGRAGQIGVDATLLAQPYVDYILVGSIRPPEPYAEYLIGRTQLSVCTYCFLTQDASLPRIYSPTQAQTFWVRYGEFAFDPNTRPDLRVWMDDDCGGSTSWSGTVINGNEAVFTWTAPPTPGLCMITAGVELAGMRDEFRLAALVDGCAEDPLEYNNQLFMDDDVPLAATDAFTLYPTRVDPERPGVGQQPSRAYRRMQGNDADWFRFTMGTVPTFQAIVVSADTVPVELYAADATTLIATGNNGLDLTLAPATGYYLKVGPGAAAATCGAQYDLELWVNHPGP
jgi:hypothetical protein